MLENYFITGLPINLKNKKLGIIHQPTIKDLLNINYTNVEFIRPFLVHLDAIDFKEDFDKSQFKNFDLFFLGQVELLQTLIMSLKLLYKVDSNEIDLIGQKIVIKKDIIIDRDNFDILSDVILEMFMTKRPNYKKEDKKFEDKSKQNLWNFIKKKREEVSKKDEMELCDIINVVVHGGGYIPYNQVAEMTYYQLINSYLSIMNITNYNEFILYKTSQKFDIKKDIKHWIQDLKIKRSVLNNALFK